MEEKQQNNEEKQSKPVKKKRSIVFRVGKWLLRLILFLFLLFVLLWAVLKIPRVQRWVTTRTTTYLSEALDTKISIDGIDITLLNKLVLEGLYIEDHQGDTLLYNKRLYTSFNFYIFEKKHLIIHDFELTGGVFNMKTDEQTGQLNARFLFDFLAGDPDKEKKPFLFDIKHLNLKDIRLTKSNPADGNFLDAFVESGHIKMKKLDLEKKIINIANVNIDGFQLAINSEMPTVPHETAGTMEQATEKDTIPKDSIMLTLDDIVINNGVFTLDNHRDEVAHIHPTTGIDFRHIRVTDIHAKIQQFMYDGEDIDAIVEHLALKEQSGFEIKKLSSTNAEITPEGFILDGFYLKTPNSVIGDKISFQFDNFNAFHDFVNEVYLNVNFNKSSIALKDIISFAPKLSNNPFFRNNYNQVLSLTGKFSGKINSLKGKKLDIKLSDGTIIRGKFSSRNLTVKDEQSLNVKLTKLKTNIKTVRQIIPDFNPPANFDKLGNLDFSGRFDGFFADFVAMGKLKTNLGIAEMDMRMSAKKGRDRAKYSGNLSLTDFDLGKWMDNPNFGKITFESHVLNGFGLTQNTANANLEATVNSFLFKGYDYKDIIVKGDMNNKFFKGDLVINDDNIQLDFKGGFDYSKEMPEYDFYTSVKKLNLKTLNISKKDYKITGDVSIKAIGKDLNSMAGEINTGNVVILTPDKKRFELDSINLVSLVYPADSTKNISVTSSFLKANLNGRFNLKNVHKIFINYIYENYSKFAEKLHIKPQEIPLEPSKFSFAVNIPETKGLDKLLLDDIKIFKNFDLQGNYDYYVDQLNFKAKLEKFAIAKQNFEDIQVEVKGKPEETKLYLGFFQPFPDSLAEPRMGAVGGVLTKDTFYFDMTFMNLKLGSFDMNAKGKFFPANEHWGLILDNTDLAIFDQKWNLSEDNSLFFGKEYFEANNFHLINEEKEIIINSYHDLGLQADIKNFDFSLIDDYWDYEQLDFNGLFSVNAKIGNIFKLKDFDITIQGDSFYINKDYYGSIHVKANAPDLKSSLTGNILINDGDRFLKADGQYHFPVKVAVKRKKKSSKTKVAGNNLFLNAEIHKYPLKIIQYFARNGIKKIEGYANGKAKIYGPLKALNIDGILNVPEGTVTLASLQVPYHINNQTLTLNNRFLFDATSTFITDDEGNKAYITGGITHDHLKNLGLDVSFRSPKFTGFTLTKEQNEHYYGTAMGRGDVTINGNFKKPNMVINATSLKGTEIFIPIADKLETSELSFIRFNRTEDQPVEDYEIIVSDPEGMNMDINLTVTQDAKMSLILDQQTNETMEGIGDGNITIKMTREGDFTINGTYEISEGYYLFKALSFAENSASLINKPFTVKKGGTILWEGDPYKAKINIEADYLLRTSLFNFLQEYITTMDEQLQEETKKHTDVKLTMILQGDLLTPNINFDLNFPNLPTRLKNYVDSKLVTLKQDQNELNKQVFGLMVGGQFIPGELISNQLGADLASKTISEFISNQFTTFLSAWLTDKKILTGFDVNVAYSTLAPDESNTNGNTELFLKVSPKFFENKVRVHIGGRLYLGEQAPSSTTNLLNEVVIEWFLTDDKRLILKAYYNNNSLYGGTSEETKAGVGLNYNREFDSLNEFFKEISN